MGGRLLFLCLIWIASFAPASAQEAEPEPLPEGFTLPMLEAPPREESGPLGKKPLTRPAPQPLPIDAIGMTPAPDGAAPAADAIAPTSDGIAPASAPAAPTGEARLKPYVDGLMSGLMTSGEFPGAVVLIIQDGKITLKAGYGFADIRARAPVDPDRTRFRVASISKLFTATAIMQLAEQGKVDLNADVNTYLTQFKIAPTYPEPVTLATIMTHTAGFDDRYLGLSAPLTALVEPLGQHLARSMPPRVLSPGRTFAYSNHAYALAGHVVENMAGQEFPAYVQDNIFAPLGMDSSTFGVPSPPLDIAVPYFKGGDEGGFKRVELDRMKVGPAGDLITTAGDLAKFMLVHMNKGVYGDEEKLLTPQTVERMHAQHFAQAEGLDGWAYGFAEGRRNGVRWIGHDGAWLGFCAQLVMVPETKTGFFLAYNADCHFAASAPLRKAMFDLIWPSQNQIAAETNPNAEFRAQSLAGSYMAVRRARSDFTVMAAAASQLTVTAPGEGRLLVHLPNAGRDLVFLPQANGTWINPDFQWKAAAVVDERGQVTKLAIDADVFDRVVGAGEWAIWSVALGLVVAICLMALWGWANGFLSRWFFGEPQAVITFWPRLTAVVAAGSTVVAMVAMAGMLNTGVPLDIIHGPTPMIMALVSMPLAIAVLAIPMVVWSMMGFGTGTRARTAQVGYAVLTIAILVFLAFAWQWGVHPFGLPS